MLRDTLKTMLSVYGPSGAENAVAAAVIKMLSGHADSFRTDAMGNLIVEKKGREGSQRILFSAHMDHIGYIVTNIEKEGYLRVANVGGLGAPISNARHVVFENGTQGVIYTQPHPGEDAAMRHLFVDIGASDREEAGKAVNIGDVCVFAPDCFELGAYRVASPAMDDRCACALLIELILSLDNPKNTVIGVFSAQEEVGMRGAGTAAYSINPDLGVALDVTAWGDTPEDKIPAISLGAGPAVKFMDRSMIATPAVRDALLKAAKDARVPVQREVLPFGGTDGAPIQHARGGIPAGTLSIPCRYVHSPVETIDMRDMDGALALLIQFVKNV